MRTRPSTIVFLAFLIGAGAWLSAQQPPVTVGAAHGNFQYIEVGSASALQKELATAGAHGFAIRAARDMNLIMEADGAGPRTYTVVSTSRDASLIEKLNEAGARGFRVVPESVMTWDGDWVVVMQAQPDGATFAYQGVKGDASAEQALHAAQKTGAQIVAIFSKMPGEFATAFGRNPSPLIVLERRGEGPGISNEQSDRGYRVVSTLLTGSLEKEINEAAVEGFRVVGSGFMTVVLERLDPARRCDYRVVATTVSNTAEREIQQLAVQGFRVVATPASANQWLFVLERNPTPEARVDYRFVYIKKETVVQILEQAQTEGFRVVGLVSKHVLLERASPPPS